MLLSKDHLVSLKYHSLRLPKSVEYL
jgi:hypothetical protein